MTRLLLVAALGASIAVPVGGVALVAADGGAGASSGPGSTHRELEKDEIIHLYNELVRIERLATPGSKGHAREARRVARDAAAWAQRNGADEHQWYEFANATSDLAQIVAQGIAGAPSFSEAAYRRAAARLADAAAALPPERQAEGDS